jgi:NAD(P)-dependent dehydrogenase (short-subunit alcohol dehydrogenase family)
MMSVHNSKSCKRVAIITDTMMHIGPHVARELAQRNHNLVIGTPADGLFEELTELGAEVEVVTGIEDLTKPTSIQSLVDVALKHFGGFDAACIRSGTHISGDILEMKASEFQILYEQNMLSVMYALQALLPPMIEAKSGQVLINTSAAGCKPAPFAAGYSATRAGANMLVKNAAQRVAKYGITVNAMGTNFMNYPGFRDMVGWSDPEKAKQITSQIPLGRLGEPKEAAHLAVALLDGENRYQTGQFFPVTGGWFSA